MNHKKQKPSGKYLNNSYISCIITSNPYLIKLLSSTITKTALVHSPFTKQSQLTTMQRRESFENILGKGENAGNQHFLLFPKCFLSFTKNHISISESHLLDLLHVPSVGTRLKFNHQLNG